MSDMTPREIVEEIDKHIIGQGAAKRAVAVALRNRWRRAQVEDETLRAEITPKNILMIGPTGVGKTEISRRLARLAKAPFIKVEATKFTEVGYVGREVDSIVRDLVDMAVKMAREEAIDRVRSRAEDAAGSEYWMHCYHPLGITSGRGQQRMTTPQTPVRKVQRVSVFASYSVRANLMTRRSKSKSADLLWGSKSWAPQAWRR